MSIKLITAPATEPVTLAEAKLRLRVDASDEDADITALIVCAREFAEHVTERALITQTWELALDAFPTREIKLPRPPLAGIVSIKYDDAAGIEQTMGGSLYVPDLYSTPGWLLPAWGTAWPVTIAQANAVRIRYVAGYGAAAAVPQGIKSWMLMRVASLYAMREEMVPGRATRPTFIDHLLDPYRVWDLAA